MLCTSSQVAGGDNDAVPLGVGAAIARSEISERASRAAEARSRARMDRDAYPLDCAAAAIVPE
jgi:hypothetical protein